MFQFEKLNVFEKAIDITAIVDGKFSDQSRVMMYVPANEAVVLIARASAMDTFEKAKDLYVEARSKVHEVAAVLILLNRTKNVSQDTFTELYDKLTVMSVMLYKLIGQKQEPASSN